MATNSHFQSLKSWYIDYSHSFLTENPHFNQNIQLKIDHTIRVIHAIEDIGFHIGLFDHEIEIARIIALFHDLGRFQQFQQYNTFADNKSENHAHLSVAILKDHNILSILNEFEQNLVLVAINFHNVAQIPLDLSDQATMFTKLIRDADKIDIYKVVCDHYQNPNSTFTNTIELGLPNSLNISDQVYHSIMTNQLVRHEDLTSVNDFKVLQLAWVFDLNFPRSFELLKERKYIDILKQTLPQTEKVEQIYKKILSFLKENS